jgi:hypothetical protein
MKLIYDYKTNRNKIYNNICVSFPKTLKIKWEKIKIIKKKWNW